jgi:hypothetical protein
MNHRESFKAFSLSWTGVDHLWPQTVQGEPRYTEEAGAIVKKPEKFRGFN